MDSFTLNIVSSAKIHYSGKATYCDVTTSKGNIGFKAKHEDFIGTLQPETMVEYTNEKGKTDTLKAQRGILLFSNNECTITLTESDRN